MESSHPFPDLKKKVDIQLQGPTSRRLSWQSHLFSVYFSFAFLLLLFIRFTITCFGCSIGRGIKKQQQKNKRYQVYIVVSEMHLPTTLSARKKKMEEEESQRTEINDSSDLCASNFEEPLLFCSCCYFCFFRRCIFCISVECVWLISVLLGDGAHSFSKVHLGKYAAI